MSWLAGLRQRLNEALRPGRAARELRAELDDHFEHEVSRQIREGVPPDEARRRAALRAGNLRAAHEAVGDERSGRLIEDAFADLRIAWRVVRRNAGFSAAVIVSLALGVGGTTAVFSVVNAILIRPLPFTHPEQLAVVRVWWNSFSSRPSAADLLSLQEHGKDVAAFAAFSLPDDGFAMATPSGPELVDGAIVTDGLPALLGVGPMVGPGFSSQPNAPEAMIGESLWRERYSASPSAIGKSIVLDGDTYTIVGVMPAGFNVPGQRTGVAWLKALRRQPTRRGPFYLFTVARLAPGLTPESAALRLTSAITPVMREKYGITDSWRYGLRPLQDTLVGDVRQTLLLLLGAMALVLLIAIVNVANLLLARGSVRARELAVRASLGAGRGRLARHLLAESALLGVLGGALGVALASTLLGVARSGAARILPAVNDVRLDGAMIAFALVCGIAAALLASVLPVFRTPWTRLAALLRDGGRTTGEGPAHGRARQALVVAEIALTVTVLTGAALLGKSLVRLQSVDPGFQADRLVSFRLSLPDAPYRDEAPVGVFTRTLEERLRANPGVSNAAFSFSLPPNLLQLSNNYTVEGSGAGARGADGVAEWNIVSTDFFSTMGIALMRGRAFASTDATSAPRVAIVNEAFVRRHYSDGRALGARLKGGPWDAAGPWITIVGVVRDVPYGKGLWGGADATVYLPLEQQLWVQSFYVLIKGQADAARLIRDAELTVRSLDARVPLRDTATMNDRLRVSMTEPRLRSIVLAMIGGLALALAITGIYGVMAYQVHQRRRETAIRRALGATAGNVVRGIVGSGLRLTLAGIALGIGGALLLSSTLSTMLFQVAPRDPASLSLVAVVLTSAAVVACAVPALRTARIDPASVLRDE